MARLTYAQVKSQAIARVKADWDKEKCKTRVLIYKDAGGDFAMKPIIGPHGSIAYTGIKALVYLDLNDVIVVEVSRETIAAFLEAMSINMIYMKFA